MTETESNGESQKAFRRGESPGKPWGGNVSTESFPKALHELAVSRGYRSQLALSTALGYARNQPVSDWFKGNLTPSQRNFDRLVNLLNPSHEELDHLSELYKNLQAQGKGVLGGLKGARRSG